MPSKSKTKGNKFENDMVKLLNVTYNTEEFKRTPNSGAMMGRSNWGKNAGLSEGVKRTLGSDLIVPDDFKFGVECKHYKDDPNYATMIKGPDTTLSRWLAECIYDSVNLELHPLLFFKTNNKGTHFALPEYFYITHTQYEGSHTNNLFGEYFLQYGPFIISGIDTFLKSAEAFKIIANKDEYGGDYYDMERKAWLRRTDVKELLEILE